MVADIETSESVESWQYKWFIVLRLERDLVNSSSLPVSLSLSTGLAGQRDGNLNPH